MNRYFYVNGRVNIPARFYTVAEITTWKDLLRVKRAIKSERAVRIDSTIIHDGYVVRVKDNAVEQTYILALHGFKQLRP